MAKTPGKKRGRPPVSEETRQNNRALKREQRKRYIDALEASGSLSGSEAFRLRERHGLNPDDGKVVVDPGDNDATPNDDLFDQPYNRTIPSSERNASTPGPKPTDFTILEKNRMIELLGTAIGRFAACCQMNVGYPRFLRSMANDEEFKQKVMLTEKSLVGMMSMQIYSAGLNGDINAAGRFIGISQSATDGAFKRKLAKLDFLLKQKAVEHQLGSSTSNRPNFRVLSNDELEDYENINTKVFSGASLTVEESARLGSYTAKLMLASRPAQPPRDYVSEVANSPLSIDATYTEDGTGKEE